MAFRFEELLVWQRAIDFNDQISQLVKSFPKDELFILTSQINVKKKRLYY